MSKIRMRETIYYVYRTQSTKYKKYTHKTYNRYQEVQIKSTAWVRSAWERNDIEKYPSLDSRHKVEATDSHELREGLVFIPAVLCQKQQATLYIINYIAYVPLLCPVEH